MQEKEQRASRERERGGGGRNRSGGQNRDAIFKRQAINQNL